MSNESQKYVMVEKNGVKEIQEEKEPKPPKNDYSKFCLSEDECNRLVEATDTPRDKAILLLMLHSALRRTEVAHLRIEDVDWERKLINLAYYKNMNNKKVQPKSKEELTVLLSDKCYDALKYVRGPRTSGWLFYSKTDMKKPICDEEINYLVRKWANRAGLSSPIPQKEVNRNGWRPFQLHKQINPHLLRHTAIRRYLAAGGTLRMAKGLARHSDIRLTINTYGAPSLEDRINEFRAVEKKL